MKSSVKLIVGAVLLLAGAVGAVEPLPVFVTEEGAFDAAKAKGHVQGIAISEDAVYCGLFNAVVKFDLATGKMQKSVAVPSHTGDICWHNGRLYTSVGANVSAGRDSKDKYGLVQVFDKDLNLVTQKKFPMILDGATILGDTLYLGYGLVFGEKHRGCKIVRVNLETLDFIDEVEIDPGFEMSYGVQDMATDGTHLILSFYGPKMAVYTKDLKLVKTIPGGMSNGLDRLPARYEDGHPVFAAFRGFTRKDVNGVAVPGLVGSLQYYVWDGNRMTDVTPKAVAAEKARPSVWLNLFNGKDMTGWTPKIRGFKAGENAGNTFRVVDGCLCNRYDDPLYADGFKQRYGHLFYNGVFSNYVLRATYRMPLPQCKGGEGWAQLNNGLMLHGQSPESMSLDQAFPVSIEYQLLSRTKPGVRRPTANLCTPGTNVERDGKLYTPHTLNSTSEGFDPQKWTTVEAEVRGGETIIHRIDGKVVLQYDKPQYDPKDGTAKPLIEAAGGDLSLRGGTISIQSESAPTDFKSILIRPIGGEQRGSRIKE